MDFLAPLLRIENLQLLALGLALLTAGTAVYRLTLHPLASFPGPKLAGVSDVYRMYFDLWYKGGGEMLRQLEYLHGIYGPVVRWGPNALHFSDPHAYFDIYRMGSDIGKHPGLYKIFAASDSMFGFMDHRKHKERRDLLNPMFQRKAILQLEYALQDKVTDLITRLTADYATTPKPVNMHYALRAVTVDIITAYCFGRATTCLSTPAFAHPFITQMSSWVEGAWVLRWTPLVYKVMGAMPDELTKRLVPSIRPLIEIRQGLKVQIRETLADPENRHDIEQESVLMRLLSSAQEKTGSAIGMGSLLTEMQGLVLAGSDTVALTSYVGLFFALANPEIMRRLQKEVDGVWPDAKAVVSYQTLEQLPYLTAFIKESLRMAIPIPAPLERVPNRLIKVAGVEVPANISVSIGMSFIHMNPDIFEDPHTFKPERWLGEQDLDKWLASFSRGSRSCLGLTLAWAELYLLLGNIIRKLDLEIHDTVEEDITHVKEYFGASHYRKDFHALIPRIRT